MERIAAGPRGLRAALHGAALLELGVFGFGLLEDGDVGVGVFPEGEKVLVGGARFRGVAGESIRACQAKTRQRSDDRVTDDAWVLDDFLEFRGCRRALFELEIGEPAQIDGNEIEARGDST